MILKKTERHSLFKACLAVSAISGAEFAKKEGVSYGHLSQVLRGLDNRSTEEKIESFIHEWLPLVNELSQKASSDTAQAA